MAAEQQQSSLALARLNLIWVMGTASLANNGNEIRIPLRLSRQLRQSEISEIEGRLSAKFNDAPTFNFADDEMGVLRICVLPPPSTDPATPAASEDSVLSASSPQFSESSTATSSSPGQIDVSKKHKVPRPPNAFILYRQKWHPQIKEQFPNMHNNDISILLGKQWKAESDEVKQVFKDMSDRIKHQHAIDNPGYQYAPRKSLEKKRRMTARKLARLNENAQTSSGSIVNSAIENVSIFRSDYIDLPGLRDAGLLGQAPLPSFDELLGTNPPFDDGHFSFSEDADIDFALPSIGDYTADEMNLLDPQLSAEDLAANVQDDITTTIPEHVTANEQFLTSLIDFEAFNDFNYLREADVQTMASLDEVDGNLPYLEPLKRATFNGMQKDLAKIPFSS